MAQKIKLPLTIDYSPLLTVLAKAVLDEGFRKKLIKKPKKAIQDAGLALSPHQLAALNNLNPAEWESLTVQVLNSRLSTISDPSLASCVAI